MTRVAELMSSPVITCAGDATLGEVAALLLEHRIHGVVVPDEVAEHRLHPGLRTADLVGRPHEVPEVDPPHVTHGSILTRGGTGTAW